MKRAKPRIIGAGTLQFHIFAYDRNYVVLVDDLFDLGG